MKGGLKLVTWEKRDQEVETGNYNMHVVCSVSDDVRSSFLRSIRVQNFMP